MKQMFHLRFPSNLTSLRLISQVADAKGAAELVNADVGGISFTDVRFGYGPDRAILKGLTFEASLRLGGG